MEQDSRALVMSRKLDEFGRNWYKFSRNPLSIIGLAIVLLVCFLVVFAPLVAPYPEHAGKFVDFANASQPPSLGHPFGTDVMGRDILSRVIFGFRFSLLLGVVVLSLAIPVGTTLGLIAGYFKGALIEIVIMRITDVFLALPPLILALAITAVLEPSLVYAMMAVSLMWWPWYCRLTYGISSSLRNEFFVLAAEVTGAERFHIIFREIVPNCVGPVFTKMSLDVGIVVLIGAALSFVGLGAQPPTPCLGTMLADGARLMPGLWWMAIFPGLAIIAVVLGFNLLGDGLRDLFAVEEV